MGSALDLKLGVQGRDLALEVTAARGMGLLLLPGCFSLTEDGERGEISLEGGGRGESRVAVFDIALEVTPTRGMGLLLLGIGLGGSEGEGREDRVVISALSTLCTPLLPLPLPPPSTCSSPLSRYSASCCRSHASSRRRKRSATRKAATRSIRAEGAPSKPENSGG